MTPNLLSGKAVEFLDAMDAMIGDPKVYRERIENLNAKIAELDQKMAAYGDLKATAADMAAAQDARERAEKMEQDAIELRRLAKVEYGNTMDAARDAANALDRETRDEINAKRAALDRDAKEMARRDRALNERESDLVKREDAARALAERGECAERRFGEALEALRSGIDRAQEAIG